MEDRSTLDDAMARLADGDRGAFAAVFGALRPVLESFCRRSLGSNADADDAAQEALEKVFSRASQYDRTRPAIAWALAIAAWECRTVKRQHQRSRVRALAADDHEFASEGPTPEDIAVHHELDAAVMAALEGLSASDRATLRAAFFEMVEDGLHVADATLRKRKERAIARLRDVWRQLYGT